MRTLGRLAQVFQGGEGPSHSTIDLIFASADASAYLGEGNKMDLVLYGLRALREGRKNVPGQPDLPADEEKLRVVAADLATRLVASGLVDASAVAEALDPVEGEADPPPSQPGTHAAGGVGAARAAPAASGVAVDDPAAVMVVHGQDSAAKNALFDWLRSIGLRPSEWNQLVQASGSASPFIGDVLEAAFTSAQAVVVLFTPDEQARLRPGLASRPSRWRLQARPNVLFEAGRAFGSHPDRTVLVVLGDQELPSDLAGRHYVRLDSVAALRDLAGRLERAGCPVNITGTDWLDLGRFPGRDDLSAAPDG